VTIAVPILPRIANFDDLDPLAQEPGVKLVMTPPGQPLPSDADLIILPGTKATLADLDFLRAEGWDIDIKAHVRRGGKVLGLCGGYQMLGRSIADPDGIEGPARTVPGLGLLPVDTALTPDKQLKQVSGLSLPEGTPFTGYEIHCGRTTAARGAEPLLCLSDGAMDGVVGQNGRVFGTYVHGLFDHPQQRALWLARLGAASDGVDQAARVDAALDALSESLSRCIDTDALLAMARSAP
jgi:adenosylcobyric acid synthase